VRGGWGGSSAANASSPELAGYCYNVPWDYRVVNRRAALSTFAVLAILFLSFAPLLSEDSSAESTKGWNGVTVTTFTDDTTVNAGAQTSISMYVYNTRADEAAVSLKLGEIDEHVTVKSNIISVSLQNKETAEFVITVICDAYCSLGTSTLDAVFTVVDLSTGESGQVTVGTPIHITSKYYSTGLILGIFQNPFPAPFDTVQVSVMISFALWVVISVIVAHLAIVVLSKVFFRRNPEDFAGDKRLVKLLVILCVILYGLTQCLVELGISEYISVMIGTLSSIVYILAMAIIVWRIYCTFVKSSMTKISEVRGEPDVADTMIPLMMLLGKVAIAVSALSAVLAVMGMNLLGILTGAGILGLALSFGAQSTISQFFGGLSLLATHPFKSGDLVRIGNLADGLRVERVGIMTTKFRSAVNEEIISMPNNTVAGAIIVNLTKDSVVYCSYTIYDVDYDSDIELVKRLLIETAMEHPHVVKNGDFPLPSTRLMSFNDSSISIRLSAYVDDAGNNSSISGELREAVFSKFKSNGVVIPYPHVKIVRSE
jgi:MscS family membrane protein